MAKTYTISTLAGRTFNGGKRSHAEREELLDIMSRHSKTRTQADVFRIALDTLAETPEMKEWIAMIRSSRK